MKKKNLFMALAAICAGFTFGSCSNDSEDGLGSNGLLTDPTRGTALAITKVGTSDMTNVTKATATEVGAWATAPDKNIGVSVYSSAAGTEAMKTGSVNMKWTYNTSSSGWETQTPLHFFPGDEGYVTAYYPYGESVNPTAIDIDGTKDYMYALIGDNKIVNYGAPQTALQMHHANAQIRVNLLRRGYGGPGNVTAFTIKSSKFASSAKLNSLTGVISNHVALNQIDGNTGTLAADITSSPTAKIEAAYAWFVPITDAAAPVTFDATVDGLKLRYTTSQQFESGKRYTFNLAVTGTLANDLVLTSVEIDPWTDAPIGEGDLELVKAESTPVDLGLPSGLKWAAGNVGAENPEDAGLYFAWGETEGYAKDSGHDFSWANYKWSTNGTMSNFSKYNTTGATLDLEDDAARVNLGGSWRMPTAAEIDELANNTIQTWTTNYEGTGKAGYILTSKTNGNSIFMPAIGFYSGASLDFFGSDGCYWSSSQDRGDSYIGSCLALNSSYFTVYPYVRSYGFNVRGVCE